MVKLGLGELWCFSEKENYVRYWSFRRCGKIPTKGEDYLKKGIAMRKKKR